MKRLSSSYRWLAILLVVCIAAVAQCQLNTWVYKARMSTVRDDFSAAAGADGRIYVFGGYDGTKVLSAAEVYDPATDVWTPIADAPQPLLDEPAVGLPDGRILIFANTPDNSASQIVITYHPDTNTYTQTTVPFADVMRGAALAGDGKVYLRDYFTQSIFSYDALTDTWVTVAPSTPNFDRINLGFVSDGGTVLYLTGGSDTFNQYLKTLTSYDFHTDVWTTLPDMALARIKHGCTFGKDGRVYVAGGNINDVDVDTDEVEAYDPAGGSWSTLAHMQKHRASFRCVTGTDGTIYAIGGSVFSENGYTDTVEAYKPAMLSASPATITTTEGTAFNGSIALLKDADTSQAASDFSASIDWGDGTSLDTATVASNGGAGQFKVTGNHTYVKAGSYAATVTITDADAETATVTDSVTVNDATVTLGTINITAQSGIAFSGPVGTLADANPLVQASDFTATIDWGDGTTTNATIVAETGGSKFDIDGTHTYTLVGTYSVHIKILEGTFQFLIHESANVVAPSAVVSAVHFNAIEGANYTGPVATFVDADPNQTALNFTATIAWGDGTTSSGTVASNGSGGFIVTGSHTYAEEGSYTTSVTVAVTGGLNSSSNGIGDVADAVITASGFDLICKGQNFSNTVAAFTDADLLGTTTDYSAAIFWGDGKSSNGTIVQAGSGWKVVGSHSYAKRGKYTATITIRDVGGSTASATTHINVGPVK